jgi:RNA polymerase sigma-70 factor (ECF subfamily)
MSKNIVYRSLIHEAQLGNEESMGHLAELVEGRLFAYIYRLTLNYDLAEDLLQETLLEMVESLKKLEHIDRFWFWLFRTAMGKTQHHFRSGRSRKMVQISALEKERLSQLTEADYNDGLDRLVRKELSEAIFEAMGRLKVKHRNVLALRCFEQMSYSEIAAILDCSELGARVLFYRAKTSLKKQLSRHGFGKAFLLVALALFGLMTTPAKVASASSSVTAASMEVGLTAALIDALASKLSIALVTAVSAITLSLSVKAFVCVVAAVCFTLLCLVLVGLYLAYD